MWHKLFGKSVLLLLVIECISWLSYDSASLKQLAFWVVVVGVLIASLYKLEYGVYAIIAELAIGSQGYILSTTIGGFNVSIRLGIFLVVMIAWGIAVAREKRIYFFQSSLWKWYVALITFLAIGVFIGYVNGNSVSNIFFDWNGYLFFGMVLPLTQAIRNEAQVRKLITVLFAGVTVLAIQTLTILFLFSHGEFFRYYLSDIYKWVRDFRIGEITLQESGFYRVFFQSHIYVVFALLLSLALLVKHWAWEYVLVLGVSTTLVFLSYSRSFWVAIIVTLGFVAIYLLWKERIKFSKVLKLYLSIVVLFIAGYVFVLGVINIPLSSDAGSGVSAGSLLTERTQDPTEDAGGGSRMALLRPLVDKNLEHPLLGSGFGTTVTYATQDQRALENNADGLYTTFAFEWGYLDLWLKLGIAGTAVYIVILWLLFTNGMRISSALTVSTDRYIVMGIMFGVVALGLIHALTPYLNHPLGIGWIVVATVVFDIYGRSKTTR